MKKSLLIMTGLALGIFSGCNQEEKPLAGPPDASVQGNLSLRLPAIPEDFLAKTSKAHPWDFTLTISGRGMATLTRTWRLSPLQSTEVTVTGIAAGPARLVTGYLIARDSVKGDSVTHTGRDTVDILANDTTRAALALKRVVKTVKGKGSLDLCVLVEGITPDSSCFRDTATPPPPPPDSLPHDSAEVNLSGCWKVSVDKVDSITKKDTLFPAMLRVVQSGSYVEAVIVWDSSDGRPDTAVGTVASLQVALAGDFNLKASSDDSGGKIVGWFTDPHRGIYGKLTGMRGPCVVPPPPPPPPDTLVSCFAVSETFKGDGPHKGTLVLKGVRGAAQATMRIEPSDGMKMTMSFDSTADTAGVRVSFKGKATIGMFKFAGKTLVYQAAFRPDPDRFLNGRIFVNSIGAANDVGAWSAKAGACPVK